MTRRSLLTLPAGFAAMQAQSSKPAILELRYFYLRNTTDDMPGRLNAFLKETDLPGSQKAGASAVAYFGSNLAPRAPFVLAVRSWGSMEAIAEARVKIPTLTGDRLPYVRMETQILEAFTGMPTVAVKAAEKPRVFELRTYESNDNRALRKKIGMFNDGEIAIFRKTGLDPVFFGEMVAGPNQPCLVYLLAYDSFAAREANWAKFLADPDWLKLRATPGLSDGEIVSNISSLFLRPLPFSPVR
ncbi:MAG: NIPSNAP family protein [Bryobacteraceae bacterium]|nr:NIPSNAP family protein [Bryobacteraceae bacterium]